MYDLYGRDVSVQSIYPVLPMMIWGTLKSGLFFISALGSRRRQDNLDDVDNNAEMEYLRPEEMAPDEIAFASVDPPPAKHTPGRISATARGEFILPHVELYDPDYQNRRYIPPVPTICDGLVTEERPPRGFSNGMHLNNEDGRYDDVDAQVDLRRNSEGNMEASNNVVVSIDEADFSDDISYGFDSGTAFDKNLLAPETDVYQTIHPPSSPVSEYLDTSNYIENNVHSNVEDDYGFSDYGNNHFYHSDFDDDYNDHSSYGWAMKYRRAGTRYLQDESLLSYDDQYLQERTSSRRRLQFPRVRGVSDQFADLMYLSLDMLATPPVAVNFPDPPPQNPNEIYLPVRAGVTVSPRRRPSLLVGSPDNATALYNSHTLFFYNPAESQWEEEGEGRREAGLATWSGAMEERRRRANYTSPVIVSPFANRSGRSYEDIYNENFYFKSILDNKPLHENLVPSPSPPRLQSQAPRRSSRWEPVMPSHIPSNPRLTIPPSANLTYLYRVEDLQRYSPGLSDVQRAQSLLIDTNADGIPDSPAPSPESTSMRAPSPESTSMRRAPSNVGQVEMIPIGRPAPDPSLEDEERGRRRLQLLHEAYHADVESNMHEAEARQEAVEFDPYQNANLRASTVDYFDHAPSSLLMQEEEDEDGESNFNSTESLTFPLATNENNSTASEFNLTTSNPPPPEQPSSFWVPMEYMRRERPTDFAWFDVHPYLNSSNPMDGIISSPIKIERRSDPNTPLFFSSNPYLPSFFPNDGPSHEDNATLLRDPVITGDVLPVESPSTANFAVVSPMRDTRTLPERTFPANVRTPYRSTGDDVVASTRTNQGPVVFGYNEYRVLKPRLNTTFSSQVNYVSDLINEMTSFGNAVWDNHRSRIADSNTGVNSVMSHEGLILNNWRGGNNVEISNLNLTAEEIRMHDFNDDYDFITDEPYSNQMIVHRTRFGPVDQDLPSRARREGRKVDSVDLLPRLEHYGGPYSPRYKRLRIQQQLRQDAYQTADRARANDINTANQALAAAQDALTPPPSVAPTADGGYPVGQMPTPSEVLPLISRYNRAGYSPVYEHYQPPLAQYKHSLTGPDLLRDSHGGGFNAPLTRMTVDSPDSIRLTTAGTHRTARWTRMQGAFLNGVSEYGVYPAESTSGIHVALGDVPAPQTPSDVSFERPPPQPDQRIRVALVPQSYRRNDLPFDLDRLTTTTTVAPVPNPFKNAELASVEFSAPLYFLNERAAEQVARHGLIHVVGSEEGQGRLRTYLAERHSNADATMIDDSILSTTPPPPGEVVGEDTNLGVAVGTPGRAARSNEPQDSISLDTPPDTLSEITSYDYF